MNSDGSNEIRLTASPGDDYQPDWSPDGTKIAFSSRRDGDYEIYVMNVDGSNPINLTNNPADDNNPAWSPDGTKIAFDSNRAGGNIHAIYVMNADGSNPTQLTTIYPNYDPTWSSDGSRIAFTTWRWPGSNSEIVVMNADGSNETRLTYSQSGDGANFPSWSPDGTKIAFCAGPNAEIYAMNTDGSNRINLTNNSATDVIPNWQRMPAAPNPVTPTPVPSPTTTATPIPGCTEDTWTATSINNAPSRRTDHTAVWTGSEMIIWGGQGDGFWNTGARYNPSTDGWTPTNTTDAPPTRQYYTVVWTGSEMIVWGASFNDNFPIGRRYNPSTNSWTTVSTTNAPSGRCYHTAVWTGSEMIVWGGRFDNSSGTRSYLNSGSRYNPSTNSWTAMSTINAPAGRDFHTAVWTGSEMIVWGGVGDLNNFNTGGRYDPVNDSWTATNTTNAPSGRSYHTAVWTGSEMIVWGGRYDNGSAYYFLNTGGRYDAATDSWIATSNINAPSVRAYHTAVWTGSDMIVWGGGEGLTGVTAGGRYNPGRDTWTGTNTINAPHPRGSHTVVWTGREMIVWGGINNGPPALNSGGRYCGQPMVPTPTPAPPPIVTLSGVVSSCLNPMSGPVVGVTLILTGTSGGSTSSDGSGNYSFTVASGGSYSVMPAKSARAPGSSSGINTLDVIAVQKHFLASAVLPPGCRLTAADVNDDAAVNTLDVIAIQHFFLGQTAGIGHTGRYQFNPATRTYPGVITDQSGQNYDALIFGDVAPPFAD